HARDPEGDPDRAVPARVHPREPGRSPELRGAAPPQRRAPDGGGRRAPAQPDAVAPGEAPGRPLEELRGRMDAPAQAPVFSERPTALVVGDAWWIALPLAGAAVLAVLLGAPGALALAPGALALFTVAFFRNPPR